MLRPCWQTEKEWARIERIELSSLYSQLHFARTKFDKWKELWFRGENESEFYHGKVRGEDDGHAKIMDSLSMMLQDVFMLIKSAKVISEERQEFDLIPLTQYRHGRWPWARLRRGKPQVVNNSPKKVMKIGRLRDNVTRIVHGLGELWEHAERQLKQSHPPHVFSDLAEFRSVSTALYKVLKQQKDPVYLDLRMLDNAEPIHDLLRYFSQQEPSVSFHCIYKLSRWSNYAQRLYFEPKAHHCASNVATNAHGEDPMVLPLQLGRIDPNSQFSFRLPSGNSADSYTVTAESLISQVFEEYPVQELFFPTPFTSKNPLHNRRLTLQQKFFIASHLAEAMLMLLGTPWLDSFSGHSLRVLQDADFKEHLCLYVDPTRPRQSEHSPEFRIVQHRQIFILGLLLLEIALETPLCQQWQTDADTSIIWHQYQRDYRRKVVPAMGVDYGKACEFCFVETVVERETECKGLNPLPAGVEDRFDLQELVERCRSEVCVRLRECVSKS